MHLQIYLKPISIHSHSIQNKSTSLKSLNHKKYEAEKRREKQRFINNSQMPKAWFYFKWSILYYATCLGQALRKLATRSIAKQLRTHPTYEKSNFIKTIKQKHGKLISVSYAALIHFFSHILLLGRGRIKEGCSRNLVRLSIILCRRRNCVITYCRG